MTKKQLRNEVLRELRTMEEGQYWSFSKSIHEHFLNETNFGPTDLIGITISRVPEVDTTLLIQNFWQQGIGVAAPKCDPSTRAMQFYRITSFEDLETVYMDLKEPNPEVTVKVDASDLTYLVVPGVVFSKSGYRIGFGGGYYDRFLTTYTGPTASLAFDIQLRAEVPTDGHDLPVDRVFTEKGLLGVFK